MITTLKNTANAAQPYCRRMTITPEKALNWLDNANVHNRNVSETHVEQLARDMKNGRWQLTHEGIAFNPYGVLLDGQHRLWAIVMADVPIDMHVWFGISGETLEVINGGRVRSLADRLRLGRQHGQVTKDHTSTLKAMVGGFPGPKALTSSEAADYLSRHNDAVRFAAAHLPPLVRGVGVSYVRAVIARAWYSFELTDLAKFCRILSSGFAECPTDAVIIKLRDQLIAGSNSRNRTVRQELYGKVERALLAWFKNENLSHLHAVSQERFPLPEEVTD